MHAEVYQFLKNLKDQHSDYFKNVKVLEVGSQDINGSVRIHFEECNYTGIDLGEAPGVDLVVDINDYITPNTYDTVISSEMLEHCKNWESALLRMYDNTKHKGMFILTCASINRHEHGTHNHTTNDSKFTLDHYRNISILDFHSILPETLFDEYCLGVHRNLEDLLFWGIKKSS
jgi:hypothetical protein